MEEADDAGLSLVELIIYLAVTALVMTVLVGLFASGLRSQSVTRQRDMVTGAANLVSTSLTTSLRNASYFEVTGDVLRARVATTGTGWACRYWWLTPGKEITMADSATKVSDPAGEATWTTLAGPGGPGQDATVEVEGSLAGGAAFERVTPSSAALTYDLTVSSGDVRVRIDGAVAPQAAGTGAPELC